MLHSPPMRRGFSLLAFLLIALPVAASAKQTVEVRLDNLWLLHNVQVRDVGGQPVLIFAKDGIVERPVTSAISIHDITAHLQVPDTTQMQFLWHSLDKEQGNFNIYPFTLRPGEVVANIPAADLPEWDPRTDRIGFSLPEGGALYLEGLELTQYTAAERWSHSLRSFWTLNEFRAHSINFLWGPLLAKSETGIDELYDHFPPYAHSGNRWIYAFTILMCAGFALAAWIREKRIATGALLGLIIGSAAAWMLLDVRMGAEFLSYVRTDWSNYVQRPTSERTLRGTEDLYGLLESASPFTTGQNSVGLLAPKGIPVFPYAQYFLSPARPVQQAPFPDDITTWIVFHRPDVHTQSGALVLDDGTVLGRGKEVSRTSDYSFVFVEQ